MAVLVVFAFFSTRVGIIPVTLPQDFILNSPFIIAAVSVFSCQIWLLVAPAFVLCREDCKGLCANCGADLNAGACACPPATDSRWDALRAARPDSR